MAFLAPLMSGIGGAMGMGGAAGAAGGAGGAAGAAGAGGAAAGAGAGGAMGGLGQGLGGMMQASMGQQSQPQGHIGGAGIQAPAFQQQPVQNQPLDLLGFIRGINGPRQ